MSLRRIQATIAVVSVIATAHVALAATADAPVAGGARCMSQDVPNMSQITVSPYFSIRVPQMSKEPTVDLDDFRALVPVQSSLFRP